jgi:hypothetical protein
MSKLVPSEHQEQVAFIQWMRAQYPRVVVVAIPNGAHLAGDARVRAIKMRKLKDEGFRAGTSDLFIAEPRNGMAGLFLEMKSLTGRPSPEQIAFGAEVLRAGYHFAVCRGADEAIDAARRYLGVLDAKTIADVANAIIDAHAAAQAG